MNSGLTSHQQLGHMETGPRLNFFFFICLKLFLLLLSLTLKKKKKTFTESSFCKSLYLLVYAMVVSLKSRHAMLWLSPLISVSISIVS